MERRRVFSGAPWEPTVGYCRALRVGDNVFVSGTAPVGDHGEVIGLNDGYAQARRCLEIIERSLTQLDASMKDVVRTRMFVTDIRRWAEYARAHQEFFGEAPPVTSMVEVRALIDPAMLIEIEVDAVCTVERASGG